MSDAKRAILGRIREGLNQTLLPDALPERPLHTVARNSGGEEAFIAEVERISGQVVRVQTEAEAAQAVVRLCAERDAMQALCWSWESIGCEGLAAAFEARGIQAVQQGTVLDLAGVEVGVTGVEAGLADTGTLVMRNRPGTPSVASLLPPVHIAVLHVSRLFPDMQSYFNSLPDVDGHVRETSNLIFVSGPSRTADIEQTLTLGAHGPREVIIVLWGN